MVGSDFFPSSLPTHRRTKKVEYTSTLYHSGCGSQVQTGTENWYRKAHARVKFCSDPVRSHAYFSEWKSAFKACFQFVFTCKIGFVDSRHAGNCGNFKDNEHEEERMRCSVLVLTVALSFQNEISPCVYMNPDRHHSGSGFRSGIKNRMNSIRIHVNKYNSISMVLTEPE